jgi:integrase
MRDLSPRTVTEYKAILRRYRAGGEKYASGLSRGATIVLRAALRHELLTRAGVDPETMGRDEWPERVTRDLLTTLRKVPLPSRTQKKRPRGLAERDLEILEGPAAASLGEPFTSLIGILIALGLRVSELLLLDRAQVTAASEGELNFTRKGGRERTLPVKLGVAKLFASLLKQGEGWKVLHKLVSPYAYSDAYHKLNAAVHKVGAQVNRPDLHPHSLRHAFVTRMVRDGAPLAAAQHAAGHASITTTQIYVDGDALGADRWMRDRK